MSIHGAAYYALCRHRVGHALARGAVRLLRGAGLLRKFSITVDALELNAPHVRGLMELWPKIHWSSADGMMPPEQLLALYRLAVDWPVAGDIVELGSWTGLTTCYLATAARVHGGGRVWAVDTFEGTKEGGAAYRSVEKYDGSTMTAFRERVRRAELGDRVRTLVGYTTDVAQRYPGQGIRLLFIDADHSYDGVRGDFESWSRHVVPGGLIVFHDYLMPEVARYVDSVVLRDPRIERLPGCIDPNIMAVTWHPAERRKTRRLSSAPAAWVCPSVSTTPALPQDGDHVRV
jgi:predicted O-methyltransferase YrrM